MTLHRKSQVQEAGLSAGFGKGRSGNYGENAEVMKDREVSSSKSLYSLANSNLVSRLTARVSW
jgi:hypothetical protein